MSVADDYVKLESYISRLDVRRMDSPKREHYMEEFVANYYKLFGMFGVPPSSFRGFHHGGDHIGGDWRGFIPYEGIHRSAVISLFDGKPFIVKGFPTYDHKDMLTKYRMVYPYVDGARIQLFNFPSGIPHGKSDDIELLFRTAQDTVNYQAYLEASEDYANVMKMLEAVGTSKAFNVILYGRDLSAFRDPLYDVECGVAILAIEDRNTHNLFDHYEAVEFCRKFGVKHVSELPLEQKMYVHYEDGDMFTYLDPAMFSGTDFNLKKAAIRDSWQAQCNNSYTSKKFDVALDKIADFYCDGSILESRDEVLRESIREGKKVSLDWYVPWVLDKYGRQLEHMSPQEIYKKVQTRFNWGAWDDKYGKVTILLRIGDWLRETDFSKFDGDTEHYERFVGLRFVEDGNLDNPVWL